MFSSFTLQDFLKLNRFDNKLENAGDEGSETTRYGGHVMCAPGSNCRIAGVRGYRVGQENVMGRRDDKQRMRTIL